MKTVRVHVSEALLEVWEAKEAVYEDTRDMTVQEVLAYFEDHARRLREEFDKSKAATSGPSNTAI